MKRLKNKAIYVLGFVFVCSAISLLAFSSLKAQNSSNDVKTEHTQIQKSFANSTNTPFPNANITEHTEIQKSFTIPTNAPTPNNIEQYHEDAIASTDYPRSDELTTVTLQNTLYSSDAKSSENLNFVDNMLINNEIHCVKIVTSTQSIMEGLGADWQAFDLTDTNGNLYILILRKSDNDFTAILDSNGKILGGMMDNTVAPKLFQYGKYIPDTN